MDRQEKGYDKKLREISRQIENILKKNDVGGVYFLQSRTHAEFGSHFTPTWSLLVLEKDDGESFRMRLKFKVSVIEQKMLDVTTGFMFNLRDYFARNFMAVEQFCKQLAAKSIITHNPGPINNDDR